MGNLLDNPKNTHEYTFSHRALCNFLRCFMKAEQRDWVDIHLIMSLIPEPGCMKKIEDNGIATDMALSDTIMLRAIKTWTLNC